MKNIKNNANRITVTILSLLLLLAAGPFFFANIFNSSAVPNNPSNIETWEELVTAVESASSGDTLIITADVTMPADFPGFTIEKDLTIKAADSSTASITRAFPEDRTLKALGPMFKLKSGTLTLGEGLILDGGAGEGVSNRWLKGDFTDGTGDTDVTRGFFVQTAEGSTLVIDGATFQYYKTNTCSEVNAGGIPAGISPIFIGGNFTMNDGAVQNNLAGATQDYQSNRNSFKNNSFLTWADGSPADLNGAQNVEKNGSDWTVSQTTSGGIYIDAPGKELVMNGGTITNNKGNAGNIVVAGGSLTINDGEISNGFADHFAGGIYTVTEDAEVRMCGGIVKNNISPMGGGVFVTNKSTFFLMGGTIDGNKSYNTGGGILVYSNYVYLLSGHITNNSAPTFGGGVYVYGQDQDINYQYVMTLHNAEIIGNKAVGGVGQDNRIVGNDDIRFNPQRSADTFMAGSGGGVWLCPAGVSEFDGSTFNIYDNSASIQGADFHKDSGFEGGVLLDFGPHNQLGDWTHTEQTGTWSNHSNGPKYGKEMTEKEATAGSPESISLDNTGKTENADSPQLFIKNNVSLRGGGVGSNGVLILSDVAKERDIDKGELEFSKTFKDLPETKMEYDMILADEEGKPVVDDEGDEVKIITFRLFDQAYANQYETLRSTAGTREFGQYPAKWSENYSKINIKFPQGIDQTSIFPDDMNEGDKINVIIREYEVGSDNKRGSQVQERFLTYDAPELTENPADLSYVIPIYPGGSCTDCANQQGCDGCSCDPGTPETFNLSFRTFDFNTTAVNAEPIEIEKYVNQAVHSDIDLYDTFSYDILAYVAQNADEVTVTDVLGASLEFAPTNGNVKVYDLGETTDKDGNRELIDSNHLPVYDVSGNEIDNGKVTPSVKQGTLIDKSKYTVSTTDNTLKVVIKNTLDEEGKPVEGEPQNVTPLRGHYIRIHFDAQISESIKTAIENGDMKYSEIENISVDPKAEDTSRDKPNVGNDPVKSTEEHSGIVNKASYDIKVKNEAKYNDTSNTVTVKPEEPGPQVEKYVNKDVHDEVGLYEVFEYDILVYVPEDAESARITDSLNEQLVYVSSADEIAASAVVKKRNNHKVNGSVAKDDGDPIAAEAVVDGQKLTVEIADVTSAQGKWIQISFKCKFADDPALEYVTVKDNGEVKGGIKPHKGVPNTGKYEIKANNEWSSEFKSNTVTVETGDKPKLKIKKTSDVKNAKPGDEIPYEITVSNTGSVNAKKVVITDTMDDDLTYVSDDWGGNCEGQTITWTVDIPAGMSIKISLVCRIDKDASGKVVNKVKLSNVKEEYVDVDNDNCEVVLPAYEDVDTGDETKVMPWVMMLILSAAAVTTGAVYRRKRSR